MQCLDILFIRAVWLLCALHVYMHYSIPFSWLVLCVSVHFSVYLCLLISLLVWIFRFRAGRQAMTMYNVQTLLSFDIFFSLCAIQILNAKHTTYINNKRRWKYCLLILFKYPYTNRLHMYNTHDPTCLGSIVRSVCMNEKKNHWILILMH